MIIHHHSSLIIIDHHSSLTIINPTCCLSYHHPWHLIWSSAVAASKNYLRETPATFQGETWGAIDFGGFLLDLIFVGTQKDDFWWLMMTNDLWLMIFLAINNLCWHPKRFETVLFSDCGSHLLMGFIGRLNHFIYRLVLFMGFTDGICWWIQSKAPSILGLGFTFPSFGAYVFMPESIWSSPCCVVFFRSNLLKQKSFS